MRLWYVYNSWTDFFSPSFIHMGHLLLKLFECSLLETRIFQFLFTFVINSAVKMTKIVFYLYFTLR
jgi:hypothetical protein